MTNYKTGFSTNIAIIVIAIIVVVGFIYMFSNSKNSDLSESMMTEEESMMMVDDKHNGDSMMTDDSVMSENNSMMMEDSYKGEILAGDKNPLIDFNKEDYDRAIKSDKLVVLYFYANWCPTCKVEFPKMMSAFNELEQENVIGFRVNYNDNQTDDFEKSLARQYGVAYQHTKVFIKDGERILKSPESWSKDRYISEINNYSK